MKEKESPNKREKKNSIPNLQVYRLEPTFPNTSPSNNTTIKTLKQRHLVQLAFHTHLRRKEENICGFNLQRVKIDGITMNNRRWFILLLCSSATTSKLFLRDVLCNQL